LRVQKKHKRYIRDSAKSSAEVAGRADRKSNERTYMDCYVAFASRHEEEYYDDMYYDYDDNFLETNQLGDGPQRINELIPRAEALKL
jgi:hypothetical protein